MPDFREWAARRGFKIITVLTFGPSIQEAQAKTHLGSRTNDQELQGGSDPMIDLAFYNAGGENTKGPRLLLVLVRRALRRILRPIFLRQVEIFQYLIARLDGLDTLNALTPKVERHQHEIFALNVNTDRLQESHNQLSKRQDELSDQVQTALAFGWDYVALVRRLATLEDQVASLTGMAPAVVGDDGEIHSSILFPGVEKVARKPAGVTEADLRTRVS